MFRKSAYCSSVGLLLASIPLGVLAYGGSYPDIRQNGWVYPVSEYRPSDTCGGQFRLPNEYTDHVGVDVCREPPMSVRPIADGCVQEFRTDLAGYGGTSGQKGSTVLLRHVTETGRFIYAVYGHITLDVDYLRKRGCDVGPEMVKKTDEIGKIAVYVGGRNHLHFGIRPDVPEAAPHQFRGNKCYSSDDCGWVDPFKFLMNNRPTTKPVSSRCVGTVCGDIALYPAKLSQARQVRFGASTYSVTDVGWWPIVAIKCEAATQHFYLIPKQAGNDMEFRAVPAPSDICAYVLQPTCSQ